MAERPRAAASGSSRTAPTARPASGQTPPPTARHSTARVSTTQGVRRSELPGWFWGALGCLTVLVVGLSIVFLMGQAGPAAAPPAATVKTVETVVAPPTGRPGPGAAVDPAAHAPAIKIEPMVAPVQPAAVGQAAPHPAAKPRPATRPIKVARSPASGAKPSAATNAAADDSDDDTEEEAPKARPRAATSAEDEAADR
jgi:hypothetical protein